MITRVAARRRVSRLLAAGIPGAAHAARAAAVDRVKDTALVGQTASVFRLVKRKRGGLRLPVAEEESASRLRSSPHAELG